MRNMHRLALLSAATMVAGFDNPDGSAATAPVVDTTTTKERKKPGPRVDPVIAPINTALTMPAAPTRGGGVRGSKSAYSEYFDKLEVGQSFGVKNKTAEELANVIANANRKAMVPKTDANGTPVFKTKTIKNADQTTTTVTTADPEMTTGKRFFAVDVDPKAKPADPDGAKARIWRDK